MNSIKLFTLVSFLCFITSCSNESETSQPGNQLTPTVGGDVDKHGCKTSAGMTWSAIRNECIALFQGGIRMAPIDSTLDKTLAAFVVLKSDFDDSQVELFIPKRKESIIIDKMQDSGEGTWKSEDYTLTKSKDVYSLRDGKDNHVLYEGRPGR